MDEKGEELNIKEKKTCFVAIGFGPKTDYETGRLLDLDKTYEHLIKPVFDELGMDCFRAKEIRHSGIIDVPMYKWLFEADIVVADISTMNPNAIYELGVRHALKPSTTIVMSENKMKFPFDLNHTLISHYEHLGSDIGFGEVMRFRKELKALVVEILAKSEEDRQDSPVYTYLKGLKPPIYGDKIKMPEVVKMKKDDRQFSDWIERAEKAKNEKKFLIAAEYFSECLKFEPHNVFLKQRLALVTYKAGEGKDKTKEETKAALEAAENILADLKPEETTDPETLGLSGAINKRLHEITGEEKYLDKAMWFYERGFYVKQDYYNEINFAYLLNVKASTIEDKYEAISFYLQAKRAREKVIELCENLINQPDFDKRGDSEWVYQTMAQAFLGVGRKDEVEKLVPKIEELSRGAFDLDTFYNQNGKLTGYLDDFKAKHDYP